MTHAEFAILRLLSLRSALHVLHRVAVHLIAQVAVRWSSIVTVARTNRVVDGDITLRHGIGLDHCWQAGTTKDHG